MIIATVLPTQSDVLTALRSFLTSVLPPGVDVIATQQNLVPEPSGPNFVLMTPIRTQRIETNRDDTADVKFTGSIAGGIMTVTAVHHGTIKIGSLVFGVGLPDNGIKITQQSTGSTPGGAGTYFLDAQVNVGSRTLSSGAIRINTIFEQTIQLDFHSDDLTASDMARTASGTFRDEYATRFFSNLPSPQSNVAPLHADDMRQMPFINEQQKYEWRWALDACIQITQSVDVPMQFADEVEVDRICVDAFFLG